MPGWSWMAILTVAVGLIATAVLPLLPVDWWWVRIGDFPRLQLLVAYLFWLGVVAANWRKPGAAWAVGGLALSSLLQLYWIFPYLSLAPTEVEAARKSDPKTRLRILTCNVLQTNQNSAALLDRIEQEQPHVVVLVEVDEAWIRSLKPLDRTFTFQLKHPLDNTYGMAFYSRLPVVDARVRGIVREDIPSIDARVELPSGQVVRLFAIHPNPPRPGEDTTKRDAELVLVGREVAKSQPVVVMGDLNDVGWSRTTNLFQEVSGLLDPRKGRGFYATYNSQSMIWRYPLDYMFHSDDFRVAELRVLDGIDSDHFPLLAELSYEPSAAVTQEGPTLDADDRDDAQQAVENLREKPEELHNMPDERNPPETKGT